MTRKQRRIARRQARAELGARSRPSRAAAPRKRITAQRPAARTVFVAGASGFIGSRLIVALDAANYIVRCGSRDLDLARRRDPAHDWVELDLEKPTMIMAALDGCDAAFYLAHGMGPGHGDDYPAREAASARAFASAAQRSGPSCAASSTSAA